MTPLLKVENVVVRFPLQGSFIQSLGFGSASLIEAVAGVSFTLKEGQTYAIVGESGSGKTTLARAIAGLHHADEGSIQYKGNELCQLPEKGFKKYRKDISMIFQDPFGCLSPRLSIKSIITEPFQIQKMKDKDLDAEAKRLLSMVGLPADFGTRYPYQLSGGQARRVGVARALSLNPKLIIADEPTAGLDVSIQGELLNLLVKLQNDIGLSFVVISHNLNIVKHISDKMGIMYLGRFVEEGLTDEIFKHPKHPYTFSLLSASPEPDPDAKIDRVELLGDPPSIMHRPKGCEFHTRCPFVKEKCKIEIPKIVYPEQSQAYSCHYSL